MYQSKTPNIISLNAPFTTPKDEDYCKQYTKFKLLNFDRLTNGSTLYDFETNKQIILAVLKFIKDTIRFDYLSNLVY